MGNPMPELYQYRLYCMGSHNVTWHLIQVNTPSLNPSQ